MSKRRSEQAGVSEMLGGESEGPDKNSLARQRTDLAEDRNIMAVERTFAGWMRTAFAAIGIGLGFHALFGELEPPYLARAIATTFILLGAMVAWTAASRAAHRLDRLQAHEMEGPSIPRLRWMGRLVSLGALVVAASLWLFHEGGAP